MERSLKFGVALATLLVPVMAQDASKVLRQAGFSEDCIRAALANGIYSERMRDTPDRIGAIVLEQIPKLSNSQARTRAKLAIKSNAAMRARMRLLEHLWLERVKTVAARDILWQGAYAAGLKIKGKIGPGIEVETKVTDTYILSWVTAPQAKLEVSTASPDTKGLMQAYVTALREAIRNVDDAVKDPKRCFALAKELNAHARISNREHTSIAAAFSKIGKQADAIALLDHVWGSKKENQSSWTVEDWVRLARSERLAGRVTQEKSAMHEAEEALQQQFPTEPFPAPKRTPQPDKIPK